MSLNFLILIIFRQEEISRGYVADPLQTNFEPTMVNMVSWLKLGIEIIGAVIIFTGIAYAVYELIKVLIAKEDEGFTRIRLLLARYLALALEFQLAADILSTAIAPTWDQIGKLAAIAIIRTALNYFLSREMETEKKMITNENQVIQDDKDESET